MKTTNNFQEISHILFVMYSTLFYVFLLW